MATVPKTSLTNSPSVPAPAPVAPAAWPAATDDASYDALTELFLGEGKSPAGARKTLRAETRPTGPRLAATINQDEVFPSEPPAAQARATIESLVMGHLPFRSGPWAAQYARAVAREEKRPVALVRVLSGETSIDVYGLPPRHDMPTDRAATLTEGVALIADSIDRWIIQADDVDEPLLAGDASIDKVTLLSGVNEVALVAAYRTIKGLFGSEAWQNDTTERARPEVRVAMIGADEDRAQEVSAKVRRAAEVFLGEPVGAAPSVGKVGPTGGVSVFRGPTEKTATEVIELLGIQGPAGRPVTSVPVARTDSPPDAPAPAPAAAPAPTAAPSAKPAPRPRSTNSSGLSSHLAGMTMIDARCPDDETVELAVDTDGSLHLLRDNTDDRGLSSLTLVNSWARRHYRLLRLATPALSSQGVEPVMHLFTARPQAARPMLDSPIRMHLLAPVTVEGRSGWFCTELN